MGSLAIYPGSFDPPTLGHISLVEMGLSVFDGLIVAVAHNQGKKTLFSVAERIVLLQECLKKFPKDRVKVDSFDGLTVDYAQKMGAHAILRGLRATLDFEYEFQMALMNKHLAPDIQSVFLMADHQWSFLSSSTVKEAASLGADITDLVPLPVAETLKAKLAHRSRPKSPKNP
jgi:pantetheine-phosphate adenylyltransferase